MQNHPATIGRAEYKPFQLQQAGRAGLPVPRTILTNDPLTNDPAQARAFADEVGPVIYKPVGTANFTADDGTSRVVYATPVPATDLDNPGIGLTMHLFQERVPKAYEIRLTVVDGNLFPARGRRRPRRASR